MTIFLLYDRMYFINKFEGGAEKEMTEREKTEKEKNEKEMIDYRRLDISELQTDLFRAFERRQVVTDCWRKEEGKWIVKKEPFIDDWNEQEYEFLVDCLKHTIETGGFVGGAFLDGQLKGFVSVEGLPIGSDGQYMDLSSIHVSQDMRRKGIGRELFAAAKRFAKEKGTAKLYISAHSAVESQAFYKSMQCVEAEEYDSAHAEKEPYDCQLECGV